MNHIELDNYLVNYQVFFKKIKHMYLRYEDKTIKITCNKNVTKQTIEAFIIKHKSWVLKHHLIEKFDLYSKKYMFVWGEKLPIIVDENISNYIEVDNQSIRIKDYSFNHKKIEDFYKKLMLKEIKVIIESNKNFLNQYILLKDITYKSQLMKSRLGSCISQKRIIKLNSILARLDKKYTKLVLYHELVHLKVSNHSKKFHFLLETIYPNHKEFNNNLKNHIRSFVY